MPVIKGQRDLRSINVFARVADRLSFTKAAQELGTAPSVVSKHISELEHTLGFTLLHRSTHGVVLTEAGQGLYQTCLQMLENIDDFVIETRNRQGRPYGLLRVQATCEFGRRFIAPLLAPFVEQHPGLRVRLIAEPTETVEDGCDVFITTDKASTPGLVYRELGNVEHVICASPAYLEKFGTPSEPCHLKTHNCLINSLLSHQHWNFRKGKAEISIEVKGTLFSNNHDFLKQFVLDGAGITRIPRHLVSNELANGQLVALFENTLKSQDTLCAYYQKSKHIPAKISVFLEYLEQSLAPSDLLSGIEPRNTHGGRPTIHNISQIAASSP